MPAGTRARILVPDSVVGERYQPFLDGVAVRQAKNGNGGELVFRTDPIEADTTFEVRVPRPGDPGIPVTRAVALTASVAS